MRPSDLLGYLGAWGWIPTLGPGIPLHPCPSTLSGEGHDTGSASERRAQLFGRINSWVHGFTRSPLLVWLLHLDRAAWWSRRLDKLASRGKVDEWFAEACRDQGMPGWGSEPDSSRYRRIRRRLRKLPGMVRCVT